MNYVSHNKSNTTNPLWAVSYCPIYSNTQETRKLPAQVEYQIEQCFIAALNQTPLQFELENSIILTFTMSNQQVEKLYKY